MANRLEYSSAPVRRIAKVQFGVLGPDEIVGWINDGLEGIHL